MPQLFERIHAPEFPHVEWLNSSPLTLERLRGHVGLIDFWDYTCVNCLRTLPYITAWHARYRDLGLIIIGVHTREFSFAAEEENLERAIRELGLSYQIINDRDYRVWQACANRYWPAKYLIDGQGLIRYTHFGEGAYADTETMIQTLLREIKPDLALPPIMEPLHATDEPGAVCYPVTPELYLGYERGRIGNPEGYQPESILIYTKPLERYEHVFYASGRWLARPECLEAVGSGASLSLKYAAAEVNLVIAPSAHNGASVSNVLIAQDGQPLTQDDAGADVKVVEGQARVRIEVPRMYNLIKNSRFGRHELRLTVQPPGIQLYAFTFVSCVAETSS